MILTGFVTFLAKTLREQQIHYSTTPTSEKIYGYHNMEIQDMAKDGWNIPAGKRKVSFYINRFLNI